MAGQFVRFCLVGALNTTINFGVYSILLHVAGLWYLLAGAIGFLSGAFSGFFLNRAWTFNRADLPTQATLIRYLAVQLFSLACHTTTQFLVTTQMGVSDTWSQLYGIGVSTIVNFLASRRFVFAAHMTCPDEAAADAAAGGR